MNIKDLRYFVAVAEHQHFGKAAAACFVSQPALSAQLKKLEDTLGVTLFERDNKHVMLTPIGRDCLAVAKAALLEVETLLTTAKLAQDPLAGTLKLAVIPTIAPYLLPKVMPALTQALPKVTFLLSELQTEPLLKQLADGEIDAGIIALPIPRLEAAVYPLFSESFVLAIPDSNPLASRKSIPMNSLEQQSLLLLEEGHCLRDQTLNFCEHLAIHERQDFRATSLETLRQMVIAKVGITVLPQMAVQNQLGIAYRPFAAPEPKREIVLVARNTSPRKPLMQAMQAVISKLY